MSIVPQQRFGRLVTVERSRLDGVTFWDCACDCGGSKRVRHGNLVGGTTKSCGCLSREQLATVHEGNKKPVQFCSVQGCQSDTSKGGKGLCGLHAQRVRRYGDSSAITDEATRRANNRAAQLERVTEVKPTTYRKLFGRHEHRAIAEQMMGRPLRRDEHVHHIDENKHNNRPDNLQVMSAKDHAAHHAKGGGFGHA